VVRAQAQPALKLKSRGDGFSRSDPGRSAGWLAIAQFLSLPLAQRRKLMRSSAAEDPHGDAFILSLYHDPKLQDEALTLALRRIRAGDTRFAFCLGSFPEDRRVRQVALEALRHAPDTEIASVVEAIGTLGGPGSRSELEQRFRREVRRKLSPRRHEIVSALAGALLRLDPQAEDAARFLASALRNRSWRVRQSAARHLKNVLHPHLKTRAMALLQAPVRQLIKNRDWETAFIMADAIWVLAPEPFQKLCLKAIAPGISHGPWASLGAAELIRHDGPRHLAEVLDWLRQRAAPDDSLSIAGMLGSALPESELVRLAKMGLSDPSPFIRWLTVGLLEAQRRRVPARMSRILKAALAQEPEQELRLNLEALLLDQGPVPPKR
jgi:hypothetical protein